VAAVAALIGWSILQLAPVCVNEWILEILLVRDEASSEHSSHAMSRLIRFISARWTRRGRRTATSEGDGEGVQYLSSATTTSTANERHHLCCCRVSLLDGTDMIVDLPVSIRRSSRRR